MAAGSDQYRRQSGQATVELMLILPVIITFGLLVAQVGMVATDSVLVHHAAREAARAAAVDPTQSAAQSAAASATKLNSADMVVVLSGGRTKGDHITASITYKSATRFPIVGRLLPDVQLKAEVTMRVE